jgi:hypothetical protein
LRPFFLLVLLLLLLLPGLRLVRLPGLLWRLRMVRLRRLLSGPEGLLRRKLLWLPGLLELLLPLILRLLLHRGGLSLVRGCGGGTGPPECGGCPLAGDRSEPFGGMGRRRLGHRISTGPVPLRRHGFRLGRFASLGEGPCLDSLEAFLPPAALALMVPVIKILIITLTRMVIVPIGISPGKSLHILRVLVIPGGPLRRVIVGCSDYVGRRISIIWSPTVLRAKKIVQHAVIKPISLVKDPRSIGPDPGPSIRILWGRLIGFSIIWTGRCQPGIRPGTPG